MTYIESPEWAAHLAGIIEHPDDDLRRLVLDVLAGLGASDLSAREGVPEVCETVLDP